MMRLIRQRRSWGVCLLATLTVCVAACQLPLPGGTAATASVRQSLVTLPLPTVGAAVTPGPIVAIVIPPTPTPTPTLTADGDDTQALIQRGETVYAESCATCHQSDGQGQGAYPALAGNDFVTADDPTPVIDTVLYGRGEMPAFEDTLSNQAIAAAISYIRNSWGNSASALSVEQVRTVVNSEN